MNSLEIKVLCAGCPKFNLEVKESGSKFGVDFVTLKTDENYIIQDNPNVSWDEIMKNRDLFISKYVPKFGKYEIEEFVGYKLMEALFITKDVTDLLNTNLACFDVYNTTRISSERIKEKLLKCFEFKGVSDVGNYTYLMFKWVPYNELE